MWERIKFTMSHTNIISYAFYLNFSGLGMKDLILEWSQMKAVNISKSLKIYLLLPQFLQLTSFLQPAGFPLILRTLLQRDLQSLQTLMLQISSPQPKTMLSMYIELLLLEFIWLKCKLYLGHVCLVNILFLSFITA